MKAEILYITDIYCIWCFGFAGVIDHFTIEQADRAFVDG